MTATLSLCPGLVLSSLSSPVPREAAEDLLCRNGFQTITKGSQRREKSPSSEQGGKAIFRGRRTLFHLKAVSEVQIKIDKRRGSSFQFQGVGVWASLHHTSHIIRRVFTTGDIMGQGALGLGDLYCSCMLGAPYIPV